MFRSSSRYQGTREKIYSRQIDATAATGDTGKTQREGERKNTDIHTDRQRSTEHYVYEYVCVRVCVWSYICVCMCLFKTVRNFL